jgi:hypothetical protein
VSLHAITQSNTNDLEAEGPGASVISLVPRGSLEMGPHAENVARPIPSLMKALNEGLAHAVGGEVVVRSGEVIGRIYLFKGAVAWVNCSSVETRVRDTLLAYLEINAEELDAALQDARQERRHFAETLLSWGLIDKERLWQCLLRYNALHLSAILQHQEDPQVLFVPLVRTYSAGMAFTLQEMLEACEAREKETLEARRLQLAGPLPAGPEPVPTPVPTPEAAPRPAPCCALGYSQGLHPGVSERLAALVPTEVLAAAVLDLEARHVCGRVFHIHELLPAMEALSAWLLTLMAGRSTGPASPPREVFVVAEDTVHTLTRSTARPSLFVWLMFDASTSVGRCLAQGHLTVKALEQQLP